jgi:hypothetical protein
VVAIVEDEHHRRLIYRYLRKRQLSAHEIRIKAAPSGSGEHWVRSMYATEVKAYRSRHARTSSALIAMIDADTHLVQQRRNQLSGELTKAGINGVQDNECIAHLIPKRNIETWFLCLTDNAVNEETDYKHTNHNWSELIPQAVEQLSQWRAEDFVLPDNCIDSLRIGVNELRRLQL